MNVNIRLLGFIACGVLIFVDYSSLFFTGVDSCGVPALGSLTGFVDEIRVFFEIYP